MIRRRAEAGITHALTAHARSEHARAAGSGLQRAHMRVILSARSVMRNVLIIIISSPNPLGVKSGSPRPAISLWRRRNNIEGSQPRIVSIMPRILRTFKQHHDVWLGDFGACALKECTRVPGLPSNITSNVTKLCEEILWSNTHLLMSVI